jgi:hypothetical protein
MISKKIQNRLLQYSYEVDKSLVVLYLPRNKHDCKTVPIINIVFSPKILDIFPLILLRNISLSLAIFMRAISMGTATTPFITAA